MLSFVSTLKLLQSLIFGLTLISHVNALHTTKCMNNGTLTEEGNDYICTCSYPYTGRMCEDYSCVNGISTGDQYESGSLFFGKRCLCDAGWTGELCDESIFNRCGENGKEIKGKCYCEPNFVGDRCNIVTKCLHGQLYNGRCSCYYGWAGDFCDKIICHQGEPDLVSERCICPTQYRGKYCDFCAKPSSSPPPECAADMSRRVIIIDGEHVHAAVIVVAFAILAGLGTLNSYLYCKIRHRTRTLKSRRKKMDKDEKLAANTICPQHESRNQVAEVAVKLDAEKFHEAPPPYETLTLAHNQAKIPQELPDSHISDTEQTTTGTREETGSTLKLR